MKTETRKWNVICNFCGLPFYRTPSAIKKKTFCGKGCKNAFYDLCEAPSRIIKKCQFCGKDFKPKLDNSQFCSSKCYGLLMRGPHIIKKGYKRILKPEHPRADGKGYVREHILVLEEKLKRSLMPGEVSHHRDGNKLNNHPGNLTTFKNHSTHMTSAHS